NINGSAHFTHFTQGILASAKDAMRTLPVGVRILDMASPIWKAKTAVCLVTPVKSANGVISGIVKAARPLPEGTTKFIRFCVTYIPIAVKLVGNWLTTFETAYKIVSIVLLSCKTTKIP